MKLVSLQSGSNGNCIYVEADGVRLLFDAGISGRQAQLRLAAHGRDITAVHALLISHDHRDHARCMGIYQRKFGVPVHVTKKTLATARAKDELGEIKDIRHYKAGSTLQFGEVSVETIPTPHDGADGVAFVVDDGQRRLGILTDLGCVFDGLEAIVPSLDAVLIESNYEPALLADGPYPELPFSRSLALYAASRQPFRFEAGLYADRRAQPPLCEGKIFTRRVAWRSTTPFAGHLYHPTGRMANGQD